MVRIKHHCKRCLKSILSFILHPSLLHEEKQMQDAMSHKKLMALATSGKRWMNGCKKLYEKEGN